MVKVTTCYSDTNGIHSIPDIYCALQWMYNQFGNYFNTLSSQQYSMEKTGFCKSQTYNRTMDYSGGKKKEKSLFLLCAGQADLHFDKNQDDCIRSICFVPSTYYTKICHEKKKGKMG